MLAREPELIIPGDIRFIAHALVIPSSDPEDAIRHNSVIEATAVQVARAYEESAGATVKDVSTPALARAAGLSDNPGFDLLSYRSNGDIRCIEVKGRARMGNVDISENEWSSACNHRQRYWLFVVYECASSKPRLLQIADPWGRLMIAIRGYMMDQESILQIAEE